MDDTEQLEVNETAIAEAAIAAVQAAKTMMTEFLGYPMQQWTRTMIVDLLAAAILIAFIVLPQICCKVTGRNMRRLDDWEMVHEKH